MSNFLRMANVVLIGSWFCGENKNKPFRKNRLVKMKKVDSKKIDSSDLKIK